MQRFFAVLLMLLMLLNTSCVKPKSQVPPEVNLPIPPADTTLPTQPTQPVEEWSWPDPVIPQIDVVAVLPTISNVTLSRINMLGSYDVWKYDDKHIAFVHVNTVFKVNVKGEITEVGTLPYNGYTRGMGEVILFRVSNSSYGVFFNGKTFLLPPDSQPLDLRIEGKLAFTEGYFGPAMELDLATFNISPLSDASLQASNATNLSPDRTRVLEIHTDRESPGEFLPIIGQKVTVRTLCSQDSPIELQGLEPVIDGDWTAFTYYKIYWLRENLLVMIMRHRVSGEMFKTAVYSLEGSELKLLEFLPRNMLVSAVVDHDQGLLITDREAVGGWDPVGYSTLWYYHLDTRELTQLTDMGPNGYNQYGVIIYNDELHLALISCLSNFSDAEGRPTHQVLLMDLCGRMYPVLETQNWNSKFCWFDEGIAAIVPDSQGPASLYLITFDKED